MSQKLCENPNCKVKFTPKRANAKFHTPKCRVEAARLAGFDSNGEAIIPEHPMPAPGAYDRAKNLAKFQKMGVPKVDWLKTGIPDFDALTMIPRGRITQIQGRYGVGKTTLCLNMIRGIKGTRVLYIDTEASLNPELLVDLELDADLFTIYNDSSYIEDIAEIIEPAAKSGKYDLIVLDSVPMTLSKTIAESDIASRNIGDKAFIFNKLVARITMDLKRTNTAMVFINQVRDKIGGYFPETYTPGGSGITFQASLIIQLKTIKSWRFPKDPKDKIYLGHEVEATLIKNKVGTPHQIRKFKLYYPEPRAITDEPELIEKEF